MRPISCVPGAEHHQRPGKPPPLNPGNPYIGSKTQNGFATMGGPDITGTLAAVAAEAIKAVWYHNGGSICAIVRNPVAQ